MNGPTPEQIKQAAHKANQMQREVMGLSNLDELRQSIYFDKFTDILDKHFPKGESKERDQAMVMLAELLTPIAEYGEQETLKARIDELSQNFLDSDKTCTHNVITKGVVTVKQRKADLYERLEKK